MSLIDNLSKCRPSGVEFISITKELTRFRQRLETEADGVPLHLVHLNAAELLSDLCVFLQLGERQHDEILGAHYVAYLEAVWAQPISLTVKH